MTKTTIADLAQKLADLATEHEKTAEKINQLQTGTESALSSISRVLEKLPSKEEINDLKNKLQSFVNSEENKEQIRNIATEIVKEETKEMQSRISYLEAKVKSYEFKKFQRQLTISNIQKHGAMEEREAIL